MKNNKIDMTKGNITKLTLQFALPLCIGNILQHLYTIVDTIVVGNFCGTTAIAAVGTSSQPVEIILFLFMGIGRGISILIAHSIGEKNNQKIIKLSQGAVTYLYICAIPLTFIGFFLGPIILKLMQVPQDTMIQATTYLQIIFLGTIAQLGYNINAGLLNGMGDSRASLIFLIISCFFNIILDLFFVLVLKMNISGVAIATVIATFASWIFSIIYIKRRYSEIKFTVFPHKFDKQIFKEILSKGIPLGLNNSLYSFGHTMMQSLINTQGSVFIAACSVGGKLSTLSNLAINALASSGLTFAGQNLGAKKYTRLKRGCKYIPILSGIVTLTMALILFCIKRPFLSIFTNDEEVLEVAIRYVHIVLSFTWCYAIFNGIINIANGLGDVKYTMIVNLLMLWLIRIPVAYLLKFLNLGKYLMAAIPISFVFGLIVTIFYYNGKNWKKICKLAEEEKKLSNFNNML